MPLKKGYDGDDGYYHIQFAISGSEPDLQKDQMTDNALNDIVTQAKGFQVDGKQIGGINIDDYHQDGLNALVGPVTDAWITEEKQVFVDLRVRKQWEDTIRDLVDSGTQLGGSITGAATKVLPGISKGVRQIDGVRLFKAALTDIPAAWETRGTAQPIEKKCPGNICSQIMKSLEIKKGANNMAKTESDSYEDISRRVETAINDKYTAPDRYSSYWVRLTFQDSVIAENWDENKTYEIPYSIGVDGEVTLGDPIEVEEQYVAKKMEVFGLTKNSIRKKPENDIMTKKTENIPEGIDEGFIDKVKGLGDDGKQFIKGLLGIEEPSEPTEPKEPGGKTADGEIDVNKTINTDDIVKNISNITQEAVEKATEPLVKRIETLEGTVQSGEAKNLEKTKTDLLTKSLDLHKKISPDMTPEEEADVVKSIKEDLETENGVVLVERDIQTMTKTLDTIADGDKPFTLEKGAESSPSKDAEKVEELRKKIANRGVE